MTAPSICVSCGIALRVNAKFCDQCGAPAAVADRSQYKQVTVLFADVVRSMHIADAVDMERLREIMTDLLERSAAVVRRYGGTAESIGDGVMALFGAPVALEDHALRGCLAALAIQQEVSGLAAEVHRRDGLTLQIRVGLDSGRVIAGEMGSGSLGYAATGEHVGMAQRMESVAPPGGVMVSASTARLVEHTATLSDPEWLRIKGSDEPIVARRLLSVDPRRPLPDRPEVSLVGRQWEMAALDAIVDRAISGRGGVVNVIGPPGIGKSRVAEEVATLAGRRGVEVFWTFGESHARDIPFGVVARLFRSAAGVADLEGQAARERLRAALPPDANPEDLMLLDDLLGIADPGVGPPQIDPDARRRRLTALVNTTSLARTEPALFIIEDAHWIDAVSESMLADFSNIMPRTPSVVLITSRPEYRGALLKVHGAQTISLAPLSSSDSAALLGELLGSDSSVGEPAKIIAERAAGNPFFAQEIVRELVQRGVLTGVHGDYVCRATVSELSVPPTVQAAISARIDRLDNAARRTLNAASVIGARFDADLLGTLGIDPAFDELLSAELIDQVRFTPRAEYGFHHPLIGAVAYESQLRSDRAEWHRRLADGIEQRDPAAVEENSALIAEHLEAAGDLHAAHGWRMRAGAWSIIRDVGAARISWARACHIADQILDGEPATLAMRIAPRTMLCVTDWQAGRVQDGWGRFEELRELCSAAGDKVSLAIGMTGLASELLYAGRPGEGSRLVSEQMALLESIGEPNLTVGLAFVAFANWFNSGEFGEVGRWSQTVIDLADGDPAMGSDFGIGSPLAIALTFRGIARWWSGSGDWRRDFDDATAMARTMDPTTYALVIAWTELSLIYGVHRADDAVLRSVEEAAQIAHAWSNDFAVLGSRFALGATLLHRDNAADRRRGVELMIEARDVFLPRRAPSLVPLARLYIAREQARFGDRDNALPVMLEAVDELYQAQRLGWVVGAANALTETLLEGGTSDDLVRAEDEIDRLARLLSGQNSAIADVTLLRLRALLARARGDDVAHRNLAGRHRAMAESLGFEGHLAWADAMG